MPVKRSIKNSKVIDQGGIGSIKFNAYSGADKIINAGPEFTHSIAIIANATPAKFAKGSVLYIYNNAGTVAWLSMASGAAPAAPTGFTDSIPLAANSWTIVNSGNNDQASTSAATVGIYIVKDDSIYENIPVE